MLREHFARGCLRSIQNAFEQVSVHRVLREHGFENCSRRIQPGAGYRGRRGRLFYRPAP
jgi:hypothetical protein